jgi:ribonuclease HI
MARLDWNRRRKVHEPWYQKPARSADEAFFDMLAVTVGRTERRITARENSRTSEGRISVAKVALCVAQVAIVHTDGGCEPNPGTGGWGVTIDADGNTPIDLWGGDRETTNNRMEMTAAIIALSVLPPSCSVTVYTDSQYLQKGMTVWMAGWKRKGFRRKDDLIPNADLWKTLDALASGRAITWLWVRGHNGHAGNERADSLASRGMRES